MHKSGTVHPWAGGVADRAGGGFRGDERGPQFDYGVRDVGTNVAQPFSGPEWLHFIVCELHHNTLMF